MALVQLVKNQAENYAFSTGNGMALGLGDASTGELNKLEAVRRLRNILEDDLLRLQLGEQAQSIVDGTGADQIVRCWERMIAERPGITVRPAEIDDAPQLFDWRNEPSVREVSREKEELSWNTHVAWVARAIQNSDVCLLIVQSDGIAAGTVRFHVLEGADWEVSITVGPAMRGRGKASEMLSAAERYFLAGHPGAVLHASMLKSNVPSYKLFRSAGYEGELDGSGPEGWYRLVKGQHTLPGAFA
jgi:RimJ/RimL family protein N-acetyltransferase